MAAPNGYEQFINDDQGYLRWLAREPARLRRQFAPSPDGRLPHPPPGLVQADQHPSRTNWTRRATSRPARPTGGRSTSGPGEAAGGAQPVRRLQARRPASDAARRPSTGRSTEERPAPSARPDASADPRLQGGRTRAVPPAISTGCPELDLAWATYASMILDRSQILIPDTDDDLTWHAFLGHSIDMQGFRAAEFAGVDPLTRKAPEFVPLKARGIGVPELAALWEVPAIRQHLLAGNGGVPLEATLDVLRAHGGGVGSSLAEAFEHFPWRKFHWSVRALLQNSAVLKPFDFSFRRWLRHECDRPGVPQFPPDDFRQAVTLEGARMALKRALRVRLERAFYMVGPAMSAYMLCDWQLWLWREGRTAVFANFKLDSFHEAFVKKFGRGVIPADEAGFARWWLGLFPELPPGWRTSASGWPSRTNWWNPW